MDKRWWRWIPGKKREQWKLEKHRTEALSRIIGDRLQVKLMAERPRNSDDTIDHTLLKNVFKRFDELEESAKNAEHTDELEDLEDDGELQGLFTAYFCPVTEIEDEGNRLIDQIEGWGIPKESINKLREMFANKLKKANISPQEARGALHALFAERDAWGDYTDEYGERMQRYSKRLFWATIILLLMAIIALHYAGFFSPLLSFGLLFAGASGSSVSVMVKMPALNVSLAGELEAYGRRVLNRTVVGAVGSLIGCALLGWGLFPISIQNLTFMDALNACTAYPATPGTGVKTLIILGVAMVLGVSERTLTSFEQSVFSNANKA
jgi:hypothetical protein